MSNNRGIFENLPGKPAASPFSVVHEPTAAAPTSPFTAAPAGDSPFTPAARQNSPFSVAEESPASKPTKIPERRKSDSPFQVSDGGEGFGFEAAPPLSPFAAAPFETAPATSPFAVAPPEPPASPFAAAPSEPAASPFAIAPAEPVARAASNPPPFSTEPASATPPAWAQTPAASGGFASGFSTQASSSALSPVAQASQAAAPAYSAPSQESDSFSIKQLELRAIFGVDREMSTDEIMQRARSLPGIRHIARVGSSDIAVVDALKQVVANLGFGAGGLKLYAGSIPIEFIRESGVVIAVQTDGGFAPGVRETLMIVARELGRA